MMKSEDIVILKKEIMKEAHKIIMMKVDTLINMVSYEKRI
jgi:hypothetical protein